MKLMLILASVLLLVGVGRQRYVERCEYAGYTDRAAQVCADLIWERGYDMDEVEAWLTYIGLVERGD